MIDPYDTATLEYAEAAGVDHRLLDRMRRSFDHHDSESLRVEVEAKAAQSLTVGELRRLIRDASDDTPIITYIDGRMMPSHGDDYFNIAGASAQGVDEGMPIIVLDFGHVTDNRGW